MKTYIVWIVVALLTMPMSVTAFPPLGKKCQRKCGKVEIPYPFGIGQDLAHNCALPGFSLTCKDTADGSPRPFYNNTEVVSISLGNSQIRVLNDIAYGCYNSSSQKMEYNDNKEINFINTPYSLSYTGNKFTVMGCLTLGLIRDYDLSAKFMTGCLAICRNGNVKSLTRGLCSGIGCCQTSVPKGLQYSKVWFDQNYNVKEMYQTSNCSYAVLMESSNFIFETSFATTDKFYNTNSGRVPVLVDWSIGNKTCKVAQNRIDSYACISSNSECLDSPNGPGYICKCLKGFEGNPYLLQGCQDINECVRKDICPEICSNTPGSFTCKCNDNSEYDPISKQCVRSHQNHLLGIAIGISIAAAGFIMFIIGSIVVRKWKVHTKRQIRRKHFQKNQELLSVHFSLSDKNANVSTKKFSLEELEKATNQFDENLKLGSGGHGTVYKGILPDQRVVAVKKSIKIEEAEAIQFINEVAILSQLNHRHIIKLFGCCLETQVPLLVYEFVSNGTLSEILHDDSGKQALIWDDYIRIAAEVAGALHYIHSAAAVSVFHRDIKSSNILLDANCSAKIADFGISRSLPIEQSFVDTIVQGTFGYLDPQYYKTGILNEKTDVYSFGILLLEFLIRKPPGPGTWMPKYIFEEIKTRKLPEIVDSHVVTEASESDISYFVSVAESCLRDSRVDRPTMKEVERSLRSLQKETVRSRRTSNEETQVNITDVEACYELEQEFMSSTTLPR